MESFVFNNFKKRLMEGDVSNTDIWKLYPVKSSFTECVDDTIKYIKSEHDFSLFSNGSIFGDHMSNISTDTYTYMTMYELDIAQEPIYVDKTNWASFINQYPGNEHLAELFLTEDMGFARPTDILDDYGKYILRGFYYVKTAEELLWCAEKVNGTIYDNKINIVLGDNIGRAIDGKIDANIKDNELLTEENKRKFKHINFSIGSNPAQPYEGIFYGNGYKILNIRYEATRDVNGIIGYLGPNGIISTVEIAGQNILQCSKKINIEHLINAGTDVVAGLLCGKNNGRIEYVQVSGKIYVTNFIPAIYSMSNKTDDETLSEGSDNKYPFYSDYYCYNSPGNIIPYIGYFNEGVAATYSGYNEATDKFYNYWMTNNDVPIYRTLDDVTSPNEWYYWFGLADTTSGRFAMPITEQEYRTNILWYDGNVNSLVNKLNGFIANQISDNGLYLYDPTNMAILKSQQFAYIKAAHYFNKSIKLSQQNRVAYYVSPIVGMNNNNISAVRENCELYTSGTFVGFIGGIAGKQAAGNITSAAVNLSSCDVIDDKQDSVSDHYYVRNSLITNNPSKTIDDINLTTNYKFIKRSIKNISSLFGSCIVGNVQSLILNGVSSYLYNYNNIVVNDGGWGDGSNINDDYYFMNRFGSFAAMVEYNSSNIPDIWTDSMLANVVSARSIWVINSIFGYNEDVRYNKNEDNEIVPNDVKLYTPYKTFWENPGYNRLPGYDNYMYGVASPIFPEIKPIYLQIPSVISTPFYNTGNLQKHEEQRLVTTSTNLLYPDYDLSKIDLTLQGELVADSTEHVGLYTIDQNLASPFTDPNFWCINTELDLPGVGNRPAASIDGAYAGGVVDRLNNSACLNFDLNIQNIARNLIYWKDSQVIETFNYTTDNKDVFTTVTVPYAAAINPALCSAEDGTIYNCCDPAVPVGTEVIANDYNANKVLSIYPYFGSDIEIIPNTAESANLKTDLMRGYNKFIAEFKNNMFWNMPADMNSYYDEALIGGGGTQHHLGNCVDRVRMEIYPELLNFAPFTDVRPYNEDTVKRYLKMSAHLSKENGNGASIDEDKPWVEMTYHQNLSGFIAKVDHDRSPTTRYLYFMVPYVTAQYDIRGNITYKNPPYNIFHSLYLISTNRDLPGGDKQYGYTRPRDILSYSPSLQYPEYVDEQVRQPMQQISGEFVPTFKILSGVSSNDLNEEKLIYYPDNTMPPDSTMVVTDLTAYKTRYDDSEQKFRFLDSNDDFTDNIEDAVSGYVWNNREVLEDKDNCVSYTTPEGRKYKYYYYNEERIHENHPSDDDERVYMSAVELGNVNSADWNWESYIVDYVNDYNYDIKTENSLYSMIEYGDFIYPESWPSLNHKGYFKNGLAYSNAALPGGNKPDIAGSNIEFPIITSSILCDRSYINSLTANYERSKEVAKKDNDILDYYKYTYTKRQQINRLGFYIDLPVKFDYQNNKRGFWFTAKDLIKVNGESVSAVSGNIEYNDELNYYGNVLFFGKTLSQEAIINKCLKLNSAYDVSGFSADDFAGIYVSDSENNPVMYIDVGLGECSDGTSWSLSSYPSTPEFSAFSGNWISTTKRELTQEQIDAYNDASIELKLASANSAWIDEMNTCSGLLLEIE